MTREWVQAQVDEFLVYWSDTGERRKSWDATFIKRLQCLQAFSKSLPGLLRQLTWFSHLDAEG